MPVGRKKKRPADMSAGRLEALQFDATEPGQTGSVNSESIARQCEDSQRAAQFGEGAQAAVGADGSQTFSVAFQACRHADAGPAANAGKYTDILLAIVFPGADIADDAGRGLSLIHI